MGGGNECLEQALWNKKVLLFGGEDGVWCADVLRDGAVGSCRASLAGTHK
jgi:hypothetical protein